MTNKQYLIKSDETLLDIASRELGNPTRWVQIAILNNLTYPFIVDTIAEKKKNANTVCKGDKILLPIGSSSNDTELDYFKIKNLTQKKYEEYLYGRDIELVDGDLSLIMTSSGIDFSTVAGCNNMSQAYMNRFKVRRGSYMYSKKYGTRIDDYIGEGLDNNNVELCKGECIKTIKQDPRTETVKDINVESNGNKSSIYQILIEGTILLIGGIASSISMSKNSS
jgi:hypothetical protein